jgi:hypothetical protein
MDTFIEILRTRPDIGCISAIILFLLIIALGYIEKRYTRVTYYEGIPNPEGDINPTPLQESRYEYQRGPVATCASILSILAFASLLAIGWIFSEREFGNSYIGNSYI